MAFDLKKEYKEFYMPKNKPEMQFAIRKAMKSAEPEAIAFWKAVAPDGKEPPIEKVIAMIALNVNNKCILRDSILFYFIGKFDIC